MVKAIEYIEQCLDTFNKNKKCSLKLVLKGSYLLYSEKIITRKPNDIDFCFMQDSPYYLRLEFINYLLSSSTASLIKKDDNLVILLIDNVAVEFILFESMEEKFTKQYKNYKNIYAIEAKYAIVHLICSISYSSSKYFLKDKTKRIMQIASDLNFITTNSPAILDFNNDKHNIKSFLLSTSWNTFFINKYYKYKTFLDYTFNPRDFLTKNSTTFNKKSLYLIRETWNIYQKSKILKEKNYFLNELMINSERLENLLLNGWTHPSLPGLEAKFIKSVFIKNKITNINNNAFLVTKSCIKKRNVLFLAHIDEIGGLVINNEAFFQGTTYWKNGMFNLYNLDNEFIVEVNGNSIDNLVYSQEKNRKINRPQINLNILDKDLDSELGQILPATKTKASEIDITARNHDNRLSVLLLNHLLNDLDININICLSTKEEILLRGIRDIKVKKYLGKFKNIINFEVSESDFWDSENILIRVADTFTNVNKKLLSKVTKICNDYAIPYKLYFGSGSTDATEIRNTDAITIAIPANSIHSMSSTVIVKNIYYTLMLGVLLWWNLK
ncbi:hypothetical protein J7894_00355 [Mycoplasmopsis agalactiae]|nr:hypothetical protein [Mycoplasmopsis agalactiae]MCE6090569.1 hypothetical protein [Mycoplasmopsis agalactiae]